MSSLRLRLAAPSVAVVGAVGFAVTIRAEGAKAEPVAEIKDVMNCNNHKTNGLFGAIKATLKAEPSAADWKQNAFRAALIAEGGNILLGLVPPKGCETEEGKVKYAGHCADFRNAAKKLLAACKKKAYEDAKTAAA